MSGFFTTTLTPTGTTGNAQLAGMGLAPGANKVAFAVIVEAVGATPTLTFKFQGALEPSDKVADASANWFDLALLPAGSDTVTAAPAAVTATGVSVFYLAQAQSRFCRRVRVVPSANTNVTWRCEVSQMYAN